MSYGADVFTQILPDHWLQTAVQVQVPTLTFRTSSYIWVNVVKETSLPSGYDLKVELESRGHDLLNTTEQFPVRQISAEKQEENKHI